MIYNKVDKFFFAVFASLFGVLGFIAIFSLISFTLGDYTTAEVIVYDKDVTQTKEGTRRYIYTKVNDDEFAIRVSEHEYSTISVGSIISVRYIQGYYGQTYQVRLNKTEEE